MGECYPDEVYLKQKARELRATCVQMAHDGKVGHLNGALSCIDILIALYFRWLNVDPAQPKNPDRDRFIFSNGHDCAAFYSVLADRGFIPREQLSSYAHSGSPLAIHPCSHMLPLLEFSSGSLGHGLGVAAGIALSLTFAESTSRTVVLMSDGECNEGSVWEAAMFSAANGLDRLLAIVDFNGIQAVARTKEVMGPTSLQGKFEAFGWAARTIKGNDIGEIVETLAQVPFSNGQPSVIIAETIAGAGISFMEDQVLWHYRTPSDQDLEKALMELGAKPIHRG